MESLFLPISPHLTKDSLEELEGGFLPQNQSVYFKDQQFFIYENEEKEKKYLKKAVFDLDEERKETVTHVLEANIPLFNNSTLISTLPVLIVSVQSKKKGELRLINPSNFRVIRTVEIEQPATVLSLWKVHLYYCSIDIC